MKTKPKVAGAIAMARGITGFQVDDKTNEKIARVSRKGKPVLAIETNIDTLHIWMNAADCCDELRVVPHAFRPVGFSLNGQPDGNGRSGMHSGLAPFLATDSLVCFNPISLDEAWLVISRMGR